MEEGLPRVENLLGLAPTATLQPVVNAQEAERQRRALLAAKDSAKNHAWLNHPFPPEDELWLFVATGTGLPVRPGMDNDRSHRVRRWVDENGSDNAWPRTIVH